MDLPLFPGRHFTVNNYYTFLKLIFKKLYNNFHSTNLHPYEEEAGITIISFQRTITRKWSNKYYSLVTARTIFLYIYEICIYNCILEISYYLVMVNVGNQGICSYLVEKQCLKIENIVYHLSLKHISGHLLNKIKNISRIIIKTRYAQISQ